MEQIVAIATNQIVMMFLLMCVGHLLYRRHFLTDAGISQMSDLVLYVANPVLIAKALMRPFDVAVFKGALWVAAVSVVTLLLSIVLGFIAYRDPQDRHAAMGVSPPSSATRVSSASRWRKQRWVPTACSTWQSQIPCRWSSCGPTVFLASGDRSQVAPRKVLTNPSVIAMVVGLGCFILSWEPPQIVMNALTSLGNLNTGLVMLVLGANLAQCQLIELVRDAAIWKACMLRLVVMPLLTLAILFLLPCVGIAAQTVVIMYQAMPVAAAASLFAHAYDRDGDFATGVVALSTLCTLATMPLMLFVGSIIL